MRSGRGWRGVKSAHTLHMGHSRGLPAKPNVRRLGVLAQALPIAVGPQQSAAMSAAWRKQVHEVGPVHESTFDAIGVAVDQAEAEGIVIFQGTEVDGSPVWRLVPTSISMSDLVARPVLTT